MLKFTFTNEKLQELRQHSIESDKNIREAIREGKIKDRAEMFTRYILSVNRKGDTSYTDFFYNYDEHFVTDIMDIIRERFPDSTVVINWNLFNYTSITVLWK
jgi:hypothetical protein